MGQVVDENSDQFRDSDITATQQKYGLTRPEAEQVLREAGDDTDAQASLAEGLRGERVIYDQAYAVRPAGVEQPVEVGGTASTPAEVVQTGVQIPADANDPRSGEGPPGAVVEPESVVEPEGTTGNYDELSKDELAAEAEARGLPRSGTKDELIARLEDNDAGR